MECSELDELKQIIGEIKDYVEVAEELIGSLETSLRKSKYGKMGIWNLNISERLKTELRHNAFIYIEDVYTKWERIPYIIGIGKKSIEGLERAMKELGFDLPPLKVPEGKTL